MGDLRTLDRAELVKRAIERLGAHVESDADRADVYAAACLLLDQELVVRFAAATDRGTDTQAPGLADGPIDAGRALHIGRIYGVMAELILKELEELRLVRPRLVSPDAN